VRLDAHFSLLSGRHSCGEAMIRFIARALLSPG
jgi:hypothetical protein